MKMYTYSFTKEVDHRKLVTCLFLMINISIIQMYPFTEFDGNNQKLYMFHNVQAEGWRNFRTKKIKVRNCNSAKNNRQKENQFFYLDRYHLKINRMLKHGNEHIFKRYQISHVV
ncbi:hypothetical protein ABPG72_004972 [Tetrahymena utriculariae]